MFAPVIAPIREREGSSSDSDEEEEEDEEDEDTPQSKTVEVCASWVAALRLAQHATDRALSCRLLFRSVRCLPTCAQYLFALARLHFMHTYTVCQSVGLD